MTSDKSPSQKESIMDASLAAVPLDELQVRQIVADVDRITTGRRRIDIAHALLNIVGQEIAANAATPAEAKHHGQLVAKQFKAFVRETFDARHKQQRAP